MRKLHCILNPNLQTCKSFHKQSQKDTIDNITLSNILVLTLRTDPWSVLKPVKPVDGTFITNFTWNLWNTFVVWTLWYPCFRLYFNWLNIQTIQVYSSFSSISLLKRLPNFFYQILLYYIFSIIYLLLFIAYILLYPIIFSHII